MPLPFIPSVELRNGPPEAGEGLERKQLSYLGCVYFTASTATLDTLFQFLKRHTAIETYVDVRNVETIDDIVSILDAGARKVFVETEQFRSLTEYGDRIVTATCFDLELHTPSDTLFSNGILMKQLNHESGSSEPKLLQQRLEELNSARISPIFLETRMMTESMITLCKKFSAIPIIPTLNLSFEKDSSDCLSVPEIISGSWISDRPDKLIPTVVTDERGVALGLVYSSQESLAESLKTGTGVYQSRKRGLWYKGATSGDTQELVRVSLDCDQDCLKFVVKQKGRGKC